MLASRFGVWWPAVRPRTYTASVVPVLLGAAIAAYDGKFNLLLFLLTLIGGLAIQVGKRCGCLREAADQISGV